MSDRYEAELRPTWRLISEETPPISTKCLFLTRWGTAQVAQYHPEFGFIAWAALPALLPEQKVKLDQEEKARYAENLKHRNSLFTFLTED